MKVFQEIILKTKDIWQYFSHSMFEQPFSQEGIESVMDIVLTPSIVYWLVFFIIP